MTKAAGLIIAAAVLASGPAKAQTVAPADLERGRWTVHAYFDDTTDPLYKQTFNGKVPVVGPKAHIAFRDGRLTGTPGCGDLEGYYSVAGDRMTVRSGWRPEATGCSPDQSNRARQILNLLNGEVLLEPAYASNLRLSRADSGRREELDLVLEEPGMDLSEAYDSWWRVTQVDGEILTTGAVAQIRPGGFRIAAEDCAGSLVADYERGRWSMGELWVTGDGCPLRPQPTAGVRDLTRERAPNAVVRQFEVAVRRLNHYSLKADALVMHDAAGRERVRLERIMPEGVENRVWRVHSYDVRGNLAHASTHLAAQIAFFDGEVEGSPGCGSLSGGYETFDQALTMRVRTPATGYCSSYNLQELRFVERALNRVARFEKRGDRYALLDERGKVMVVLGEMDDTRGLVQRVDTTAQRRLLRGPSSGRSGGRGGSAGAGTPTGREPVG